MARVTRHTSPRKAKTAKENVRGKKTKAAERKAPRAKRRYVRKKATTTRKNVKRQKSNVLQNFDNTEFCFYVVKDRKNETTAIDFKCECNGECVCCLRLTYIINSQKSEIERLERENENLHSAYACKGNLFTTKCASCLNREHHKHDAEDIEQNSERNNDQSLKQYSSMPVLSILKTASIKKQVSTETNTSYCGTTVNQQTADGIAFKCSVCDLISPDKDTIERHIEKAHKYQSHEQTLSKSVSGTQCSLKPQIPLLNKTLIVNQASQETNSSCFDTNVIQQTVENTIFKCSECNLFSTDKDSIERHIETAHVAQKHEQSLRKLLSRTKSPMKRQVSVLNETLIEKQVSSETNTSCGTTVQPQTSENTIFKCPECNLFSPDKNTIDRHTETAHMPRKNRQTLTKSESGTTSPLKRQVSILSTTMIRRQPSLGTNTPTLGVAFNPPTGENTIFKCSECNLFSPDKYAIKKHTEDAHMAEKDGESLSTSLSETTSSAEKDTSVEDTTCKRANVGIKRFYCSKCSYVSRVKGFVQRHIAKAHKPNAKKDSSLSKNLFAPTRSTPLQNDTQNAKSVAKQENPSSPVFVENKQPLLLLKQQESEANIPVVSNTDVASTSSLEVAVRSDALDKSIQKNQNNSDFEESISFECRSCKNTFDDKTQVELHMLEQHGTIGVLRENYDAVKTYVTLVKESLPTKSVKPQENKRSPSGLSSQMKMHLEVKPKSSESRGCSSSDVLSDNPSVLQQQNETKSNATANSKANAKRNASQDVILVPGGAFDVQKDKNTAGKDDELTWYGCKLCRKIFYNKPRVELHMSEQHGQNAVLKENYEAIHNDIFTISAWMNTKLIAKPNTVTSYVCNVCKFECEDPKTFGNHMKSHSKGEINPGKSHACKKGNTKESVVKARLSMASKCMVCNKMFPTDYKLRMHMKFIHMKKDLYYCDQCGKSFKEHAAVKQHVRIQHDCERPFPCTLCDYRCGYKSYLKKHIAHCHSNERPYLCSYCPSAFKMKYLLAEHELRHKNVRQHTCEVCRKSFVSKSELRQHFVTHSAVRGFSCSICESSCKLKGAVMQHIKRNHPDVPLNERANFIVGFQSK